MTLAVPYWQYTNGSQLHIMVLDLTFPRTTRHISRTIDASMTRPGLKVAQRIALTMKYALQLHESRALYSWLPNSVAPNRAEGIIIMLARLLRTLKATSHNRTIQVVVDSESAPPDPPWVAGDAVFRTSVQTIAIFSGSNAYDCERFAASSSRYRQRKTLKALI